MANSITLVASQSLARTHAPNHRTVHAVSAVAPSRFIFMLAVFEVLTPTVPRSFASLASLLSP